MTTRKTDSAMANDSGRPEPAHVGKPRQHHEEEKEQREDVFRALDEDGRRPLGDGRPRPLVQRDDRRRFSGPHGQHGVRDVPDELRADNGSKSAAAESG